MAQESPVATPNGAAPLLNGPSSVMEEAGPASPDDRGRTKKELPKPYRELFFNNDFGYLDAPVVSCQACRACNGFLRCF